MSYTTENIQKASALFFLLLKENIISAKEPLAEEYINSREIREIVNTMAIEGNLRVFDTRENIHLVSTANGSIFANSYTQMKEKYKALKNKKYFYLANIIICVFLSEVDKENNIKIRWEEEGISYAKLEGLVNGTINSWISRSNEEEGFSENWGIALKEIEEVWSKDFSPMKNSKTRGNIDVVNTTDNRFSFIYRSLKPLADQKLIYNNTKELKIIPRNELYERLDKIYHNQDRYKEFMALIEAIKEENRNAKNNQV
ncbi:hypothetical protein KQI89_08750 [Clostridium sp. MSJ-4]|uniref:Uncharacterized protein n=1 Tax=Clostridium simiarum TaxID=2841506 RepID=A0ABS6F051_9CLOT|nr:DUF6063 family protein [Clostridium simiarum]MBU5591853.1 hypothetical protein [Clostridium simiarum]